MEDEIGTPRFPYLVIVARDQPETQQYLIRNWAAHEGIDVVLDRRQGERRQGVLPHDQDRRFVDRRRTFNGENHLSCHGFAIIHRQKGGLTSNRMH